MTSSFPISADTALDDLELAILADLAAADRRVAADVFQAITTRQAAVARVDALERAEA